MKLPTTMSAIVDEAGVLSDPSNATEHQVVDRQKYAFSCLYFLNRIDPKYHSYVIPELLVIFHAIDVTIYNGRVTDWLKSQYGRDEASSIIKESLRNWQTLPLKFEVMKSFGITVTCRSGASKEALDGGVKKSNDCNNTEEEESDEEPQNYIEEVQGITEDGDVNGTILACIHEDYESATNGVIPERWYKAYKKN